VTEDGYRERDARELVARDGGQLRQPDGPELTIGEHLTEGGRGPGRRRKLGDRNGRRRSLRQHDLPSALCRSLISADYIVTRKSGIRNKLWLTHHGRHQWGSS